MGIVAKDRGTLRVYLYVLFSSHTPSLYCSDKNLKFTFNMARFTQEHRTKIVEVYFPCNNSIIAVQRIFF